MSKHKIEVGQKVWFKLGLHRSTLTEGEVTKVGRKYITVNGDLQFDIETLVEKVDYGAKGRMYLAKEDYENKVELRKNIREIQSFLESYNPEITLEQSRKILEILRAN